LFKKLQKSNNRKPIIRNKLLTKPGQPNDTITMAQQIPSSLIPKQYLLINTVITPQNNQNHQLNNNASIITRKTKHNLNNCVLMFAPTIILEKRQT